jgi:hypothetical protein
MAWEDFDTDHAIQAAANLLIQHGKNKPFVRALVAGMVTPLNDIEQALNDLYNLRWLQNATGVQLDMVGTIVGQSRESQSAIYYSFFGFAEQPAGVGFGQARIRHDGEPFAESTSLPDAEYRSLLYAKIARNNSHGTVEDILTVMKAVFNVNTVLVNNIGVASIAVFIGRYLAPSEALREIAYSLVPKLAGVGLTLNQYNPAAVFGFAEQGYLGFGAGSLASDITNVVM